MTVDTGATASGVSKPFVETIGWRKINGETGFPDTFITPRHLMPYILDMLLENNYHTTYLNGIPRKYQIKSFVCFKLKW